MDCENASLQAAMDNGSPSSFESTCVALAHAKMARAARLAKGATPTIAALEDEMVLVGRATQACETEEARVVS